MLILPQQPDRDRVAYFRQNQALTPKPTSVV